MRREDSASIPTYQPSKPVADGLHALAACRFRFLFPTLPVPQCTPLSTDLPSERNR